MLLTVTISLYKYNKSIDIQTSSQQRIVDVLKILEENNAIAQGITEAPFVIRSEYRGTYINPYLSFEQADILNADIISIQ